MANLILLRHGQSLWNLENKFTGWTDVDLSENGVKEARVAGKLLEKNGISWDVAYTSLLKRAIRTLHLAAAGTDCLYVPEIRSWRLNERHYGALQGLDKSETAKKYGEEQVRIWRRSYDIPPPMLKPSDARSPLFEKKYRNMDPRVLPMGESLKTTCERVLPFWNDAIAPVLLEGKNVLISAHGNSLRALVKYLKQIPDSEIPNLEIPTGIPQIFEMRNDLSVARDYYIN